MLDTAHRALRRLVVVAFGTLAVPAGALAIEAAPPEGDSTPPAAGDSIPLLTAPFPRSSRPLPPDLPPVKMGQPVRKSLLDGVPGRKVDDEIDAVVRGRRKVRRLPEDVSFTGRTYESPEDVAQAILDQLYFAQPDSLLSLRATPEDFSRIFWPEFPQSRPITNMKAGDAWMFHDAHCRDGVKAALAAWGGRELHLAEVQFTEGLAPYSNFNLLHGVRIHAVTNEGEDAFLGFAPVLAERNGRWQVFQFRE